MDSKFLYRTQLSGQFCECPPLFGEDVLLTAQGCHVKVISLTGGEMVGSFVRHRTQVTCISRGLIM